MGDRWLEDAPLDFPLTSILSPRGEESLYCLGLAELI